MLFRTKKIVIYVKYWDVLYREWKGVETLCENTK